MASEKFCLKWNDFQNSITSSFQILKSDSDFTDVTLACEDGQQIEAHKVILTSSSPFFLNLLKKNKHPHPLIFMRGVKHDELAAIMDFLYCGETNVYKENLDAFLSIAGELQLKGLTDTGEDKSSDSASGRNMQAANLSTKHEKAGLSNDETETLKLFESERTIALPSSGVAKMGDFQELDEQIKSMMGLSQDTFPNGRRKKVCNVCGKEADYRVIKDHIEANHIEGVSIPCNNCGKIFRLRSSLQMHINKNHKLQY